jgi:hypothetical protein
MNLSKLYVPNPQEWVRFFNGLGRSQANSGQVGGGRVAQIIPIDLYASSSASPSNHGNGDVSVKRVSPAEQTVDQAKNDLERENINPALVKEAFHSTSARGRKRTSKHGGKASKVKKTKSAKTRIYTIKKSGKIDDVFG